MRTLRSLGVLAVGIALGAVIGDAVAGRLSSGVYVLPAGNPVIPGTVISSSNENTFRNDVAAELTNSLSRSGQGGMTAALQLSSGTAGTPALTFTSNPTTGLYLAAANNPAMSVGGTQVVNWSSTNTTFAQQVTVNNAGAGGAALQLKPGTADRTFIEFYARTATPSVRSGYVGFPTAGDPNISVVNNIANGSIGLTPGATGVIIMNKEVAMAGGNPASTTAFTNTLTPTNLVKAWARVLAGGGATLTVSSGFNIASVTCAANVATVTMASATTGASFGTVCTPESPGTICTAVRTGASTFTVEVRGNDGSSLNICGLSQHSFTVIAMGPQ